MSNILKVLVVLSVGASLAYLPACSKKGGGGSSSAAAGTKTKTNSSKNVDTESDDGTGDAAEPCLWVQGEGVGEGGGEDGFGEGGGGSGAGSPSGSDTTSSTSTDTDLGGAASGGGSDVSIGGSDCSTSDGSGTGTGGGTTTGGLPSTDGGTIAPNEPGGVDGGGGWNAGPGLEDCEAQGLAWKAVIAGGPGACSTEQLVPWCCTEANVLAHFPSMANQLTTTYFQPYGAQGLKLYHCSRTGDKTTFHFAKFANGSMAYKTVYVNGPETPVAEPAQCDKATSEDLGIIPGATDLDADDEDGQDDEGDEGTSTATSTSTSTSTGGTVPEPIGELALTGRDELVAWIKGQDGAAPAYRAWAAKDANCIAIPDHTTTKAKRYYNTTAVDSLDPETLAANGNVLAKGAIAVLETYDSACTKVNSVSILARGKTMSTKTTAAWLYYKEIGGPTFEETDPVAYGMGVATCATCHKVDDAKALDVVLRKTAVQ